MLGLSHHIALPGNRWPHIRMDIKELPDYIRVVDEAIERFPELTTLKAAECELADEYYSFFQDSLHGEHRWKSTAMVCARRRLMPDLAGDPLTFNYTVIKNGGGLSRMPES